MGDGNRVTRNTSVFFVKAPSPPRAVGLSWPLLAATLLSPNLAVAQEPAVAPTLANLQFIGLTETQIIERGPTAAKPPVQKPADKKKPADKAASKKRDDEALAVSA